LHKLYIHQFRPNPPSQCITIIAYILRIQVSLKGLAHAAGSYDNSARVNQRFLPSFIPAISARAYTIAQE
jgi:hypothetical protein